ncbi:hypothetical protein HPB48_022825 [Haemaphysalis longicornis]|uniref:Carboxylesterase type B domain-containing protein n=1 Tax=Haemaphysalis longicornis TaxID=44386 RepID=A0A9J6GVG2_HAELO|nr:hypothetical protein HPB48_022825 [Haemaphysalis longicornis]
MLFKRVICQSGGITTAGRAQDKNKLLQYSREFAQTIGCYNSSLDNNSSERFAGCLQSINASLLTVIDAQFQEQGHGLFNPIYGDDLLPVEPKLAEFPGDKDVIIGQVANEGTNFVYLSFRDTFSKLLPPRKVNKLEMIYFIRNMYGALTLPQTLQLQQAYMKDIAEYDYGALRQALIDIRGHSEVTCGSLDVASQACKFYRTERGRQRCVLLRNELRVLACSKEHPWVGMTHGDDFPFVFGRPFDKKGCAKGQALQLRNSSRCGATLRKEGM